MGLGGVLRTVDIRRGKFHESTFLPVRVSSVFNPWLIISLSSLDCGIRNGKSAVKATFFIFFRQIAYRGLGTTRWL
jgi:hypothetical protein